MQPMNSLLTRLFSVLKQLLSDSREWRPVGRYRAHRTDSLANKGKLIALAEALGDFRGPGQLFCHVRPIAAVLETVRLHDAALAVARC